MALGLVLLFGMKYSEDIKARNQSCILVVQHVEGLSEEITIDTTMDPYPPSRF